MINSRNLPFLNQEQNIATQKKLFARILALKVKLNHRPFAVPNEINYIDSYLVAHYPDLWTKLSYTQQRRLLFRGVKLSLISDTHELKGFFAEIIQKETAVLTKYNNKFSKWLINKNERDLKRKKCPDYTEQYDKDLNAGDYKIFFPDADFS